MGGFGQAFQVLSLQDKNAYLRDSSPTFRGMSPKDQAAYLDEVHYGPRLEAPAGPEGSAGARLLRGVGRGASTLATAPWAMLSAPSNPLSAVQNIALPAAEMATKSSMAQTLPEKLGYGAAAALPMVGPYAAQLGERAGRGDIAGTVGELGAVVGLPEANRAVRPVLGAVGGGLEKVGPAIGKAGSPVGGLLGYMTAHWPGLIVGRELGKATFPPLGRAITGIGERLSSLGEKPAPVLGPVPPSTAEAEHAAEIVRKYEEPPPTSTLPEPKGAPERITLPGGTVLERSPEGGWSSPTAPKPRAVGEVIPISRPDEIVTPIQNWAEKQAAMPSAAEALKQPSRPMSNTARTRRIAAGEEPDIQKPRIASTSENPDLTEQLKASLEQVEKGKAKK